MFTINFSQNVHSVFSLVFKFSPNTKTLKIVKHELYFKKKCLENAGRRYLKSYIYILYY